MKSAVTKKESDHSIRLEIPGNQRDGMGIGVEPWGSLEVEVPRNETSTPTPEAKDVHGKHHPRIPEKRLTLFALRLALLEKGATGLGKLAFVWATVVLLGGFASSLKTNDFWSVTAILIVEGTRIFSRSHELEWQHEATKTATVRDSFRTLVSSSRSFFRAVKSIFQLLLPGQTESSGSSNRSISNENRQHSNVLQGSKKMTTQRSWRSTEIPLLPYAGWVFLSKNVSRVLVWLQVISAAACAALSLMRLIQQHFGEVNDQDGKNRSSALNVFYALSLTEATMFLLEKAYWEWRFTSGKLLEQVCRECKLGEAGIIPVRRFFYDAYSRCINGSIFDGVKMDLISFAVELLDSDSSDEQLIGAQILENFVMNDMFGHDTLQKIGRSTVVTERLVEMLNWKNPGEEGIRRSAAKIISKLAGKKQNAVRVAGLIGAIESVSSLLYAGQSIPGRPHEISSRLVETPLTNYDYDNFNLLGLSILKKLARDHDNCGKIGSSRGLLSKIINFTGASQSLLRNPLAPDSQIRTLTRALTLVKMLVSTTGTTGKKLRRDISERVFSISNIRDILRYGENHMALQKLGIEILTSLAIDGDAKEMIGNTGGVIKLLVSIFFEPGLTLQQVSVSIEAGETLALLALESSNNCRRIFKNDRVVEKLVSALSEPVLRINSSRILRNLCAYSGTECLQHLRGVTDALSTVLVAIMVEKDKLLEVSVGLAAQIFRLTNPKEYDKELQEAGIKDVEFAERLIQILEMYNCPDINVPRIRLYVIDLAVQMMKSQKKNIEILKNLVTVLDSVEGTTSELESFIIFSGSVGISRHKIVLSSLIETALELIAEG